MDHNLEEYSSSAWICTFGSGLNYLGACSLLVITLVIIWMKTFRRPMDPRIPVFKFPYWSILGSIGLIFPSKRTLKEASMSVNSYLLQAIQALSVLHQENAIFGIWLVFNPVLVLNKTDAVKELLSSSTLLDKSSFSSILYSWVRRGLFTREGSTYRPRRKLLNSLFHLAALKDFQCIFDQQSRILVSNLKTQSDKESINITEYINLCTFYIVCEAILGVKMGSQMHRNDEYLQAVHSCLRSVSKRAFSPEQWIDCIYQWSSAGRQYYKNLKIIHAFSRKVIKERKSSMLTKKGGTQGSSKAENTDGKVKVFLDRLLDIHLSNAELTEEDIREEVDTFLIAGHDTVYSAVSWALYLIGLHPDVQTKIHEELFEIYGKDTEREVTKDDLNKMRYLECVFKESQRIYPVALFITREVMEDSVFYGYNVRKGTTLVIPLYTLHRDPNVFPDPEKFDPSRFFPENSVGSYQYTYIPFSAGPRNCIGQQFAMMEVKTIMAHILRNFVVHSLDPRDKMKPSVEMVLRASHPWRITISKRVT